ncbi:MAG: hypothetical protein IPH00_00025 [Flavobacteriales bacterium]|nr:hypothetical protein [Flavobacteriales bacterium]
MRAQTYIACHFWDARGPKILSAEDLRGTGISLKVVADISCDIDGPIDSTLGPAPSPTRSLAMASPPGRNALWARPAALP